MNEQLLVSFYLLTNSTDFFKRLLFLIRIYSEYNTLLMSIIEDDVSHRNLERLELFKQVAAKDAYLLFVLEIVDL